MKMKNRFTLAPVARTVYCRGGRIDAACLQATRLSRRQTRKNSAASDGGSYIDCTKAIGSPLAISRA